jgi:hypothetical protein
MLVISLVILLGYTTYTTLLKAKSQYNKENVAIEKARKSVLLKSMDEEVVIMDIYTLTSLHIYTYGFIYVYAYLCT